MGLRVKQEPIYSAIFTKNPYIDNSEGWSVMKFGAQRDNKGTLSNDTKIIPAINHCSQGQT